MNFKRVLGGAGAALVAALLVPVGPAAARTTKSNRADSPVRVHVESVSPSTPLPSAEPLPLLVTLTLTNSTSEAIDGVEVVSERGDPIGNLTLLTETMANPLPPTSGLPIAAHPALEPVDLEPGVPTTVVFRTTTSVGLADKKTGLCICANAQDSWIYPLFFSAHAVIDGVDNLLGSAATYVPIFYAPPAPVRVSWVWPLLDRPHRLLSDSVFTDDDLATSLSSGRLSRALAVVEQVGDHVPLTLVIDPELLDEIEVMANEQYTVEQQDGDPQPGTGQDAATTWLQRLRAVLLGDPNVTVRLTPYADPDVETLTERDLKWAIVPPPTMRSRVSDALAGRPQDASFSWPVTGAVSQPTLRRLYGQDVRTLLLNASAVTLSNPEGSVPAGIVNLETDRHSHQVAAALLAAGLQRPVARAVSSDGDGSAALPQVMAELAIRAVQEPDVEHAVVIAPPRYVDPDVAAAVNTIEATTDSTFSEPIALQDAVSDRALLSSQLGRLAKVPTSVIADLPPTLVNFSSEVGAAHTIRSLLDTDNDPAAAALVAALPEALQRAQSSAWRAPANVDAATTYAQQLFTQLDKIRSGVHLVRPSGGRYTLASADSPLPITITNTLPYAVHVRIKIVVTANSGLNPEPTGVVSIEANQTKTVNVPATTERSGLIRIEVLLKAPNNLPVGVAQTMTVRSTALGKIGVIITIVAGAVLGIALLWRIFRRLRNRRPAGQPPAEQLPHSTPEPVG